ncbi:MAG: hypothetical protein M4579_005427 [Chaenotheca gracillima]|nr:MAG: hypothetical protein M4579_005427 [Chaenotheca gracillima]
MTAPPPVNPAASLPPPLNIPSSNSTVRVTIVDSTARLGNIPSHLFFQPDIPGKSTLDCASYTFLIEHSGSSGGSTTGTKKYMFDLSMRKDWTNLVPKNVEGIKAGGWTLDIKKNVSEVLEEGGVRLEEIDGIFLSHHHGDHIGDPSTFPSSTDLIVGPGWKKELLPGYPANPDSSVLESDYAGRTLREIDFSEQGKGNFKIGRFNAFDFFGDGSFYLLDSPGHAPGHMCGLARTTRDTFILMGGDLAHHGGQFRPSQYVPLPDQISPNPLMDTKRVPNAPPCPGHLFEAIHPQKTGSAPFYHITTGKEGRGKIAFDPVKHQDSLEKLEDLDAWPENVFVIIAHDPILRQKEHMQHLQDTVELFPKGDANLWKEKGWAAPIRWSFLGEFKEAVELKQKEADLTA